MHTTTTAPTDCETRVLKAWEHTLRAGQGYALQAVLTGFLLLAFRAGLSRLAREQLSGLDSRNRLSRSGDLRICHSGKSSFRGRNQHSCDEGFLAWLSRHSLCQRTAYRWMDAAARVARKCLGLQMADPLPAGIAADGMEVPFSTTLSAPESELPGAAMKFRRAVIDFLSDKTLGEAALAAVDGDAAGSRITRAAGGREANGRAAISDRKEFAVYAGDALADALAHIGAREGKRGGHWAQMSPAQRGQAQQFLGSFVRGLHADSLEFLADTIASELRWRGQGNPPKPLELRAAVNEAKIRLARAARKTQPC